MADASTAVAPPLRFRLLGTWHPVLLNQLDSAELVTAFVADVVGRRDVDVTVRARMRRDLNTAITMAREGDAQAMFIATEIIPGEPMPVTLTVYARPELRMSPAVGTAAETVMAVLIESLETTGIDHIDTASRLSIPGSQVLRMHRIEAHRLEEQPDLPARTLTADYWYTVPGTKQIVIATLSTPLADIPNLMLDFFDAIVSASYWQYDAD